MAEKLLSDRERFLKLIVVSANGCWEWQLSPDKDGYGLISVGSDTDGSARRMRAQRFAYEEFVGPIPEGMETDHLCRNRICVNPAHLEAVSAKENRRRIPKSANCPHGHALSGDNLYVDPRGNRQCRECRRQAILALRSRIGKEAVNNYQREWERKKRRKKSA